MTIANLICSPFKIPVELDGLPGGGGGDGAPVISASTVLKVPADYPDIQTALDFADGHVFINRARVRIEVAAGFNTTQQHAFMSVNARHIEIAALGAGVTVTTTGFAAQIPGYPPALFFGLFSAMPTVSGVWTATGANASACAFALPARSLFTMGSFTAASACSGFGYGMFCFGSDAYVFSSSLTATAAAIMALSGSKLSVYGATATGVLNVSASNVELDTVTLTAGASGIAAVCTGGGVLHFNSSTVTGSVGAVGGKITGQINALLQSGLGATALLSLADAGELSLKIDSLRPLAGSSAAFVSMASASRANVRVQAVVGSSTGNVCTLAANSHSTAQISGVTGAQFTGGYSQAVDTTTADGLIMAA